MLLQMMDIIINTGHMVSLIGFYIKLFVEKNANSGQFYTEYP